MILDIEMQQIILNLKSAILLIANKDYDTFIQQYADKQFSGQGADFFLWLKDYLNMGALRTVTMPPDEAFDHLDMGEYEPNYYYVLFTLWIDNIESDLTLECNFDFRSGKMVSNYTDLHAL